MVSQMFCCKIQQLAQSYSTAYIYVQRNNRLLTKREGRTGEYWPEVVAVRTEQSEVGTATTEGQYSSVQPEQARLVSGLLYDTVSDSKMQWHTVSDSKMQLQKPFVTESDKSSC